AVARAHLGGAVKRRHRHMQRGRNAQEPPGRDAVRALLVLLQLLERDADLARERALREALVEPERAQLLPDCEIFRRGATLAARDRTIGGWPTRGHGSSSTGNVIALPRPIRAQRPSDSCYPYIWMIHKMQLPLVRRLIGMFVDRIVSEIIPDETGAARLQQLGLFILIFVLEANGTPVTAARLAEITQQKVSAVQLQLVKLESVGVIERRKALSKSGRGRALHLFIKHNEKTEKLMQALGKVAPKGR